MGSGSGSASIASLLVRHFPPYHFVLARSKRLRAKRGHPRLETYDAQVERNHNLKVMLNLTDTTRSPEFVVCRLYRSALSFPSPYSPFSIQFSTLPHSLPWRWCSVNVVESRRRQALGIGAFFLAPPHYIRVKVRDPHVRSRLRHRHRQSLSRICTVLS